MVRVTVLSKIARHVLAVLCRPIIAVLVSSLWFDGRLLSRTTSSSRCCQYCLKSHQSSRVVNQFDQPKKKQWSGSPALAACSNLCPEGCLPPASHTKPNRSNTDHRPPTLPPLDHWRNTTHPPTHPPTPHHHHHHYHQTINCFSNPAVSPLPPPTLPSPLRSALSTNTIPCKLPTTSSISTLEPKQPLSSNRCSLASALLRQTALRTPSRPSA